MVAVTDGARRRRLGVRNRHRSRAVVAALVILAFGTCLLLGAGGADVVRNTSNIGLVLGALSASAACFWRRSTVTGSMRRSWLLLGLAVGSWGLGQATWTWYESVLGDNVPFPSMADVGYLGLPVFTTAGLLLIPMRAERASHRARSVLDGLLVAASLLLMSWVLVLGPLIDAGADNLLALVISLAYPATDIVIVTVVLYLLARERQTHEVPMPLLLVGAGLITFAFSDSCFAYLTLTGAYHSGSWTDVGWFAGFVLIALAALKPTSEQAAQDEEEYLGGSLGVMLPYVAVLGALCVVIVQYLLHGRSDPVTFWSRNAVLLLLTGRQMLTLIENRQLTRHLEARVVRRTAELARSEQRFRALVTHSSDVVTVVDRAAVVTYQGESVRRVLGYEPAALVGKPLTSLFDLRSAADLQEALDRAADRAWTSITIELPIRHHDSRPLQVEITITNLLEDPSVGGLVLNTRDVTQQNELEQQLVHEAFHDALTSLANRALFRDRVEQALRRRDALGSEVAVVFLDLDGFKEVNDSKGHAAGDALLVAVASRLRDQVRPEDTVARFGGDEFAVLLDAPQAEDGRAETVARRLLEAIRRPVIVDREETYVRASIGIAFAGVDADDADQLLRNADLAMYRAKGAGGDGFVVYDPGMYEALVDRLQLAEDMRKGLDSEQFEIYYQATVDLESGAVLGFEALTRWNHPDRGLVAPSDFIPLAESTGLIRPLGTWVLREACRQAAAWTAERGRPLNIAVNVSVHQLSQPDFLDIVREALRDSGLTPQRLCLEMTESVVLNDTDDTLRLLNELKGLGIRLAIDDFGTGYSSLSYLHKFPFDILKIDRSFVDRFGTGNGSADEMTLTRTIVQLGQGLGVTTVAEGLEHFDQYLALRRLGCDVGQGYYFSRPVPVRLAEQQLAQEDGRPVLPLPEAMRTLALPPGDAA